MMVIKIQLPHLDNLDYHTNLVFGIQFWSLSG